MSEINNKKVKFKSDNSKKFNSGGDLNICSVAKKCGGCSYQGVPYSKQLKKKEDYVRDLLAKYCKVEKIKGMDNPYHYRNKVHAVFGHLKNGEVISGVYKEGTHIIVPVKSCQIEDEQADSIINDIRGLLKSFKIKTYDEDTGYGLLRHVLIRKGFKTGEVMVVLVLGSPILPSKNNFVKAIRKLHPEITTIILNINNKKTNMILGDKETVLYGKGFIEDYLCNKRFKISSKSFYQVNPVQTEYLYKKAIELADLTGKERIIDAYCGIGTIGIIAADNAKEVIAVESNRDAVKDAVVNVKLNKVENVQFYKQDAGVFMQGLAESKEKIDVVFMDPPRAGSDENFIDAVAELKPERVVYISCNPVTLEQDLAYFKKKGYKAREVWPFDMFPFSGHVETVILMTRCGQNDK